MRVLIVDDHPLYIRGVESLLLELDSTIETLGAGSVEQALSIARDVRIDLILLDLDLPGMADLDALVKVKEALPAIATVVVSANENSSYIWRAIEIGAAGYIPKDTDQVQVIEALRQVIARGIYVPQQVLVGQADTSGGSAVQALSLSERQMAVLQLLLQGKANKVIAYELGIAEGTTKAHLFSIYQTLGVNSRLQAMAKAYQLGLVDAFSPTR